MKENKSQYKIYSRARCDIFKKRKNNKNNSIFFIIVTIFIAIIVFVALNKSIDPIFRTLCENKAHEIATIVTNEETTKVMANYKYEDMFTIEKDENGNMKMINANILTINEITSDIAINIQNSLDNYEDTEIKLAIGSFLGSRLLSSIGPNIKINLSSIGKVNTEIKSEFESKGINQTIHRVYLQVNCIVNILTPYENFESNVSNQVLLMENVIIGEIPQNYFNIEN